MGKQRPRRIGLFGGTFDPVHIGHLRSALETAELLGLDELRLLPAARPPHRETPQVSAQQRLAMVELAVAGVAPLTVDARELARDKPSYTIDTLESLRAELGSEAQLFLMVGWDAFCGLPTWHRWDELLQHCHMLVLQRRMLTWKRRKPCAICWRRVAWPTPTPSPGRPGRSLSSGRRPWRCRPPRSAPCWRRGARRASWCRTRY